MPERVRRPSAFAWLAVVTTAVALLLVTVGGAVRATDSGLACPTWPGCFAAGDFVPPLQLNVWLEHSHRLLAGVVALLIAAQLVWVLVRHRDRRDLVWPVAVAAVAVLAQAALGALVVLELLRAELVTAHLGMGMLVVGCLVVVAVRATLPPRTQPIDAGCRRLARTAAAVAGLTLVQILVGGHVTGIGAGLAFVGRAPYLGVFSVAPVDTPQTAFNVAHRLLAAALVVAVAALVIEARRGGARGWLLRLPRLAAALVGVQIVLGVANLASRLSFVTVIPHLAVASWLWAALVATAALAARLPATPASAAAPVAAAPEAVPAR